MQPEKQRSKTNEERDKTRNGLEHVGTSGTYRPVCPPTLEQTAAQICSNGLLR